MNKKGSVVIEATIVMSMVIVLVVNLVSLICIRRVDINMQRAVDASCEKIAVFPPLSVTTSDIVSTISNALDGSSTNQGIDAVANAASLIFGIDDATGNSIMELALDGTLGQVMRDDIAYEFRLRNGSSKIWEPTSIVVDYQINEQHSIIDVEVTYKTQSILGSRTRTVYSVIPLYGDINLRLNVDLDDQDDESSEWDEDNFKRGELFRDKYGANLPKTFPVIDVVKDNQIESILSIDLTAPTYNSGDEAAYNKICEEINKLADFNGADVMISGTRYTVSGDDYDTKILNLIIPSNSGDDVLFEVNSAIKYGENNGIIVNVYEDGESYKYISE